ncbi:MAG: transcriptional regulator NrdR [Actinomycetota bacterium]|nr:transcriptional regulator NrdR [Actinomycetota bacterium]
MRCPSCHHADDRVVDSREVEHGAAIRRRRECLACGHRFTTFERFVGSDVLVAKRSGRRELFDREKVAAGVRSACKNRPVDAGEIDSLVDAVADQARRAGVEVSSQEIGVAVLDRLRELDDVAYLRFASVYKGFEGVDDFAREVGLLTKQTAPKSRGAG